MGAISKQPLSSLSAALDKKLSQSLMLSIRRSVEKLPVLRIDT
jgi:hypothetical protein